MTRENKYAREVEAMLSAPPKHDRFQDGIPVPLETPITIDVAQSRRATTAVIAWRGVTLAVGVAKRHPKDREDPALGQAIALSRALAAAAQQYADRVEEWTRPAPPAPNAEALKALRKQNRIEARRRKDARRLEARERYERENPGGWRGRALSGRAAS